MAGYPLPAATIWRVVSTLDRIRAPIRLLGYGPVIHTHSLVGASIGRAPLIFQPDLHFHDVGPAIHDLAAAVYGDLKMSASAIRARIYRWFPHVHALVAETAGLGLGADVLLGHPTIAIVVIAAAGRGR